MTYNFDPDKWYDDELFLIQSKLKTGEITQDKYEQEIVTLDKKHEEMWKRLDGTYQFRQFRGGGCQADKGKVD